MVPVSTATKTWKETTKEIGGKYGVDKIAEVVTNLLVSGRAETTNERIHSQQQRFLAFIRDVEKIDESSVTFNHVVRFVSFLAIEGKNKSARPFMAPLREWFGSKRILWTADEREIERIMDGFDRLIVPRDPQKIRTALPPDAVMAVLQWGESEFQTLEGERRSLRLQLQRGESNNVESNNEKLTRMKVLRDVLVVLVGYQFCLRASSLMTLTCESLYWRNNYLAVKCLALKGKTTEQVRSLPARQIPTECAPGAKRIAGLLHVYLSLAKELYGNYERTTAIFRFEEEYTMQYSQLATDCLERMLERTGFATADMESFTSHSLRKGAASAAYGIGARVEAIQWLGNWAPETPTVMDRYVNVDPRYGGDDAREFFSWLLQKL